MTAENNAESPRSRTISWTISADDSAVNLSRKRRVTVSELLRQLVTEEVSRQHVAEATVPTDNVDIEKAGLVKELLHELTSTDTSSLSLLLKAIQQSNNSISKRSNQIKNDAKAQLSKGKKNIEKAAGKK